MTFVPLHNHSDYSLLDGASQIPQMIKRAQELNMPAIALTDHGVMYGAIELLKETKGKDIKPIIGNEMYILNGDHTVQERLRPKYHQVVLAKNLKGYQNLVKLTTISHLEGFQGKGIFARPCINKETLAQYHEGLIVTSACLGGEIPQAILQKKPEIARQIARWYKDLFGDDYYLELQDHGSREDRVVNPELVRIAQELDIKLIVTNDSHFISCLDVEAHDALLCIMTGKTVNEDKRLHYSGTEYIKSTEEMKALFLDHLPADVIEEALANTLAVADKIDDYRDALFGTKEDPVNHLPEFPVPEGYTSESYLRHLAEEGLRERFPNGATEVYWERLRHELDVIEEMTFPRYFLVVWDYIKYAREVGIPTGLGRGSAAGSLVSYCLHITNIDPIHHGLLFERFLNKYRISMPDVDTDFCPSGREKIIEYVTGKYGSDRVAQIVTFNRMTSKAVLKDIGRVLNVPYAEADRMSKMVPVKYGKPAKLKTLIADDTQEPKFREYYETGGEGKRWIDLAMRVEGTNKSSGIHAAGVVISDISLDTLVPLERSKEGVVFSQYPMEDIEALGLLKMDFLGLKNLTIIQKTVDLIKEKGLEAPDMEHLTMTDPKTFALMAKGWLEGVFQLESSGMRATVASLQPNCIEDISAILALYRPGPLAAGMVPAFINRKHKREEAVYDHPLLEPILKETYGVIVYQEAVMKISVALAGYSLYDADSLRKIVGKKKAEQMIPERIKFLEGCDKKDVDRQISEKVWSQIETFGEYGFNLSHSMSYAYLSYQTAYLKANYPTEYMAALLTANAGDQESVQKYLAACVQMGIKIDLPDINRPGIDFTPAGDRILFGLSAIKNLGNAAIEAILVSRCANGPYGSIADLCDRISINKRALEALIHAGAFDALHPNRKQLLEWMPEVVGWASVRLKDRLSGQMNFLTMMEETHGVPGHEMAPPAPDVIDYKPIERLRLEKEILGFYVSDHPLKGMVEIQKRLALTPLSDAEDIPTDTFVYAVVMVSAHRKIFTKKGDAMSILTLEDLSGRLDAVAFPKTYEKIGQHISQDARLFIQGKITRRDERPQLVIEWAERLEAAQMLLIDLVPEQAEFDTFQKIRGAVIGHRGEPFECFTPVVVAVNGKRQSHVTLGRQFWVQDAAKVLPAIHRSGFTAQTQSLLGVSDAD